MKKNKKSGGSLLVIALMSLLFLGACSNKEVRSESATTDRVESDNSRVNQRIDNNNELTAQDQGSSDADIKTTQNIRKQVVNQDHFSTDAKNVKIITRNGNVFLKGPVKTMAEKNKIESIAKNVAGTTRVTSEITVTK